MNKRNILLSLYVLSLVPSHTVLAEESKTIDYLQIAAIEEDEQTDCAERGGKRVFVINQHSQQVIDVQLDRFFSGVRQGGRSMFAIAPSARQALGCDIALDAKQHWDIVAARFITPAAAIKRYGVIQPVGE